MNRLILRYVLATAVGAGVLVAVLPQHAVSVVRLAAGTAVVLAASLVLRAVAPVVARHPTPTALDRRPSVGAPPLDPHGLRDARRDLDRPAAPGSVPPVIADRLASVAARAGQDLDVRRRAGTTRDPAAVAAIVHRTLDRIGGPDDDR